MIYLIFLIGLLAVLSGLLYFAWQGAPYLPSQATAIAEMVELAALAPGDVVAELGSGDGRVAIALALAPVGARVVGFELNPLLVWWSRWRVRRAGLAGRVTIRHGSFWSTDLSGYSVVAVFGMTHIMARLQQKLKRELRPGARVVSNVFRLPDWPVAKRGRRVLLYKAPGPGRS